MSFARLYSDAGSEGKNLATSSLFGESVSPNNAVRSSGVPKTTIASVRETPSLLFKKKPVPTPPPHVVSFRFKFLDDGVNFLRFAFDKNNFFDTAFGNIIIHIMALLRNSLRVCRVSILRISTSGAS
jgi:hypothetical protein